MVFLNYLINGISLGSIYAIIALGYTMVYGIAKMLNFAHGDVIMVGAYICFFQHERLSSLFARAVWPRWWSRPGGYGAGHGGVHRAGHHHRAAGLQAPAAGHLPGGAHHRHRRELLPPECGPAPLELQLPTFFYPPW